MADVVPTNLPSWNDSLSNVAEPLAARKISEQYQNYPVAG